MYVMILSVKEAGFERFLFMYPNMYEMVLNTHFLPEGHCTEWRKLGTRIYHGLEFYMFGRDFTLHHKYELWDKREIQTSTICLSMVDIIQCSQTFQVLNETPSNF